MFAVRRHVSPDAEPATAPVTFTHQSKPDTVYRQRAGPVPRAHSCAHATNRSAIYVQPRDVSETADAALMPLPE